jgi:hypothetical protein
VKSMRITYDPKFTAFMLLNDFLDEFLKAQGLRLLDIPGLSVPQLTPAAADCVHKWARKIGDELTKPEYQPEGAA